MNDATLEFLLDPIAPCDKPAMRELVRNGVRPHSGLLYRLQNLPSYTEHSIRFSIELASKSNTSSLRRIGNPLPARQASKQPGRTITGKGKDPCPFFAPVQSPERKRRPLPAARTAQPGGRTRGPLSAREQAPAPSRGAYTQPGGRTRGPLSAREQAPAPSRGAHTARRVGGPAARCLPGSKHRPLPAARTSAAG